MKKGNARRGFGRSRGALPRLRGRGEQGIPSDRFLRHLRSVSLRRRANTLLEAHQRVEIHGNPRDSPPIEIDRA